MQEIKKIYIGVVLEIGDLEFSMDMSCQRIEVLLITHI